VIDDRWTAWDFRLPGELFEPAEDKGSVAAKISRSFSRSYRKRKIARWGGIDEAVSPTRQSDHLAFSNEASCRSASVRASAVDSADSAG
jgi:hypothetical protein